MSRFKDYYFILGISKTATQEDVENAYRYSMNLINAGNAGSFAGDGQYQASLLRDIDEAYECLRNPILRCQYDYGLDADRPAPLMTEAVNPALRLANSRETLEMCFAAMKKKKSRSLPSLGRFLSGMLFLASVGYSTYLGLNYFNTGNFGSSAAKQQPARTQTLPSAQAPPAATPPPRETAPARTTSPSGARQGYVKVYDIRSGGVISAANTPCRENPSQNSRILVRMPRNEVVFVTKESKDEHGTTWYFVDCRIGEGWVPEDALKVYK
ncbi:MAG: hypothetical protein LBG29_02685 [Synergistaceae bacterium]|nr:hypothetical protein [Synergistaceae bacterium]